MRLVDRWRDASIPTKLYSAVGIMAVLLACELLTLRFAMQTLSAARSLVGGEGFWSKAQKSAAIDLLRYGETHDEQEYQTFLKAFDVPDGDHQARLGLLQPQPDPAGIRRGFQQGRIEDADIGEVVDLLRRFSWTPYLSRAIAAWTKGDELIADFKQVGLDYHAAVSAGDRERERALLARLLELNHQLTVLEDDFSFILGAGSRWLEFLVLTLLSIAVLMVEGVGLTLTFFTARSISRGLRELNQAAVRIGHGDLGQPAVARSHDEVGQLALSLNQMREMLRHSYSDLEARVAERTQELVRSRDETGRLHQIAEKALASRDEFLSIASHELKTPLTSLRLRLDLAKRRMKLAEAATPERQALADFIDFSGRQVDRLTRLIDDLMDVSRIQSGKLEFSFAPVDLSRVVREIAERHRDLLAKVGSSLSIEVVEGVGGSLDEMRIEQLVENLLTNAARHAPGEPVALSLRRRDGTATLIVEDHGPGVPLEMRERIFERFERGAASRRPGGLGLGLFIAREIARGHGGAIEVVSAAGRGARFVVTLPLARAAEVAAHAG